MEPDVSLEGVLYHLGCGNTRLEGYVNVDIRSTPATDLTTDLNELDLPRPARGLFSHAFFEHLRRDARLPHLQAARRLLADEGFICYLGLPDFRAVAELYLSGGPGVVGPTFDLYNVYRYTHGDPENVDYYFAQLHKSLFDFDELERLLADAGYPSHVIFTYVFPTEAVRVTLGFFATAAPTSAERLYEKARQFLGQFDGRFLQCETIEFARGQSRSHLRSRARASSARLALRPISMRLARRLARI